jgi:glycosyltransferase involved in cell wall biosynthesis
MKILFLTQFYPPEFGAAAVRLSRLAKALAAQGHDVTVLTSVPNYPEGVIPHEYRRAVFCREPLDEQGGVDVRRVWVYATPSKRARARLLNQFSFLAMAALRGSFLPRPDAIFVESHPLFVALAGGWLKRIKRAPILLNVSDLWPESAVATGALSAGSPLVKIAERAERWAYHDAAHIVALTEGVREGILNALSDKYAKPLLPSPRLRGRGAGGEGHVPESNRVSLIRNAVDLARFRPASPDERAAARHRFGLGDAFTAVHVGNMSLTYDMDVILETAVRLPQMRFLFAGGGSQAAHVEAQIAERGLSNVTLLGILPHGDMPALWAAADACLIALRDHSVAGGTLPAKLYEAIATGTPVIAAIRGEGAALVEKSGVGIVVAINDADAYSAALHELANDPERAAPYRAAARAYAEANLGVEGVTEAYVGVLETIVVY